MFALEAHIVSGPDLFCPAWCRSRRSQRPPRPGPAPGFAAGGHQVGEFQKILEFDELRSNGNGMHLLTPHSSAAPAIPYTGSFPRPLWER